MTDFQAGFTKVTRKELNKFISFLQKNWLVYGPTEQKGKISIELTENPADLFLDDRLPFFSFKNFFVPECEILFEYKKSNLIDPELIPKNQAVVGINLLDLKSVLLYDQVFEKDPYYQKRRQNTLVVGHSMAPPIEQNIFETKYEEDILEHLSFDIFLVIVKKNKFKVFTGSEKGQKILKDFGYADYRHIQFSGPVKEEGNARMEQIRERMKNHYNSSIWEKLGETCLECGKCTIICPTCFCFRIDDQPSLEKQRGKRQRRWDSCFYQEFSEVAGGFKFLSTAAKRIHYWYYHKFVRIPDEFSMMGCTGCGRCYEVCPVRINIRKILKEL